MEGEQREGEEEEEESEEGCNRRNAIKRGKVGVAFLL